MMVPLENMGLKVSGLAMEKRESAQRLDNHSARCSLEMQHANATFTAWVNFLT